MYSADKRRNQGHTGFSACNGLGETKEEGKIAVYSIFFFQFSGSLNTFPSRGNFDKYAFLLDAQRAVQGYEFFGLGNMRGQKAHRVDKKNRNLCFCRLFIEGQTGINLGRDTTRDDF